MIAVTVGVVGAAGEASGGAKKQPARSTKPTKSTKSPKATESGTPRRSLLPGQIDQTALLNLTGYNLRRAGLCMQAAFEQRMTGLQLTQAEFSVLVLVDANTEINQKSLADALAISPPNMAVLLDRLAARALLTRQRKTADRRSQILTLTGQGIEVLRRAAAAVRELDQETTAMLDVDERLQLNLFLQRIFRVESP